MLELKMEIEQKGKLDVCILLSLHSERDTVIKYAQVTF